MGNEHAEQDSLLQDVFYESAQYQSVESREDRRCFIIGRTGSGKSAILQRLEEEHDGHVIRIDPDDLSMPYITNLGVVRYLADLNIRLDAFFNALWKHVLIIEIIRHRYSVNSEEEQKNFLRSIRDRIKRDPAKQQAIKYLEEFENRFWVETDVRVREITERLESEVAAENGGKLNSPLGTLSSAATDSFTSESSERRELADRFQRIVNSTQLSELNKMITVLNDYILNSPQWFTYVVIDDLDRDWVDERIVNDLVRCLFRAVRDLQKARNLKVVVALRTNIFDHLDFGPAGGQEEKYRSLTLRLQWSKADLENLLNERVVLVAERQGVSGISTIRDVLPRVNKARGDAFNFILRRTLMRPRDAIAYFNECFQLTGGKPRISWDVIKAAESPYSRNRLLALRDEWKPTFPGIDRVFKIFAGAPVKMSVRDLQKRLDEAILLVADYQFAGLSWMTSLGEPVLSGADDDWAEIYQPLIRMLFDIGFLGCSQRGGRSQPVYSYEEPGFADSISNVRDSEVFYIHPAFRAALEIDRGDD